MNLSTNTKEIPGDFSSATQAVESILEHAATLGASDVHCDPRIDDVLVRMRIDGILEYAGTVSKDLHEEIIARLKILSGARTDLHYVPQDGRFRMELERPYNIRISFMPTYYGENAVMRLLPVQVIQEASFLKLGFTADHVRSISVAIQKTSGLILATGPTGSGKTTTLHACLSHKVHEPLSIVTLEDPIEYEIPGVRQIHVRHSHGMTFAAGLRAVLRQDPDIIMVGEIRDAETARVAIHTALTGHLVFSTLHTNSALESIPRLMDMGVDPYLLASTLKLLIGQRLVRTACGDCDAGGCVGCRSSGYRGRSVIAETCEIDAGLKSMILRREPVAVCLSYARSLGFHSMADDGFEKVEWGLTSREEVLRVLSE